MLTPRQRAALWRWGFVVLGLAALVLGFCGFMAQAGWSWDRFHVHDALFKAVQLFALAVSVKELENPATQLASVLAPASTAATLWLAFLGRIRRRWRFLLLVWRPAGELFLGGGETAAAIVAQRGAGRSAGHDAGRGGGGTDPAGAAGRDEAPVVGLDPAADTPLERRLRATRTPGYVIRGDAQSPDYLNAVNAGAARKVWVLAGDDLRNIAIARRVIAMRERIGARGEATIIVSVREPALAHASAELWRPRPGLARIEYFDLPRRAARRLLQAHPPPYPTLAPDGQAAARAPHLCIVGTSDLAPALLVHAALHCVVHEDPAHCLRVTWIGPDASARMAALHRRHPALDPANAARDGRPGDPLLAGLLPLAQIVALDADPAQLAPRQWLELQHEAPFSKVYVTAGHELATRAALQRVQAVQDVCAALGHPAAEVVACLGEGGAVAPSVRRFDALSECFVAGEAYPGERRDALARIVHLAYVAGDPGAATPDQRRAAEAGWTAQTDDLRWSSRCSADHIEVKLALLGLSRDTVRLEAADPGTQPLLDEALAHPPTLQRLMRIEHRRFLAERLLGGWLPLPEPGAAAPAPPSGLPYDGAEALTQKAYLRLNRTLVAFDALSEEQKRFDREIIQAIPACLREERRQAAPRPPQAGSAGR
ncbi:MAG: hypothetical protein J0H00_05190 [Burkholderiales bacterium]|nr:hypothetical protein [Burkholderiales bacterium]OJX00920.1 MAG: hypothetical protein BGO72_06030 [Burkholderiales bacterium 70-64]